MITKIENGSLPGDEQKGGADMQALPRETTDYIAEKFREYFEAKAAGRLTLKDARKVVDYLSISGPASEPVGAGAHDTTKPHVKGGGRTRPTQEQIERILDKKSMFEPDDLWNEVFDEVLRMYNAENNIKAKRFIGLCFKKQLKREDVCKKMHISEKTFNNYRIAILTAAGICAVQKGCNIDT